MVILRATEKVLKLLREPVGTPAPSETALGDWYVNRVVVDRRPLLLLMSSASRLAIVTAARDVRTLPERLAVLVGERIRRLGLDPIAVTAEVQATSVVRVGKTLDRSVTGQMVDFAKAMPFYLPEGAWGEADLKFVEDKLAERSICWRADGVRVSLTEAPARRAASCTDRRVGAARAERRRRPDSMNEEGRRPMLGEASERVARSPGRSCEARDDRWPGDETVGAPRAGAYRSRSSPRR